MNGNGNGEKQSIPIDCFVMKRYVFMNARKRVQDVQERAREFNSPMMAIIQTRIYEKAAMKPPDNKNVIM